MRTIATITTKQGVAVIDQYHNTRIRIEYRGMVFNYLDFDQASMKIGQIILYATQHGHVVEYNHVVAACAERAIDYVPEGHKPCPTSEHC